MKPGVTTEFETTEFAGITAKIINPYPNPFTVLDMTIKPGFGAPAHISSTEDKLFMVIEGQLKYLIGDKTEIVGPGARRDQFQGAQFTASQMLASVTPGISLCPRHAATRNSSATCTTYRSRVSSTWTNYRDRPTPRPSYRRVTTVTVVPFVCPRLMVRSSRSNYWRADRLHAPARQSDHERLGVFECDQVAARRHLLSGSSQA